MEDFSRYNKLCGLNVIGFRFFYCLRPRGRPDMALNFLSKIKKKGITKISMVMGVQ